MPRDGTRFTQAALDSLRSSFRGELLDPEHARYDAARVVWNARVDRRPALIARCTGAADVLAAVRFAREQDVLVAVRGGGHDIAGNGVCDGGMVIDLGPLSDQSGYAARMHAKEPVRFVDLDAARAAGGLRLVVVAGIPSPWSEAAKGIFSVKGLDFVAVRWRAGDEDVQRWTGCHNAPVAMFHDEPPRSGWAEILALGERLGGAVPLLPEAVAERALILGLAHEILGELGLVWCGRLLLIHSGLTSEGRSGFPPPIAHYLARKYGYAPERAASARQRVLGVLSHLSSHCRARRQAGQRYLVGERLSALDIYVAAALGVFAPLPHALCPMHPALRAAFESVEPELLAAIAPELLEHRDSVYREHLGLPIHL